MEEEPADEAVSCRVLWEAFSKNPLAVGLPLWHLSFDCCTGRLFGAHLVSTLYECMIGIFLSPITISDVKRTSCQTKNEPCCQHRGGSSGHPNHTWMRTAAARCSPQCARRAAWLSTRVSEKEVLDQRAELYVDENLCRAYSQRYTFPTPKAEVDSDVKWMFLS